ncbi:MAG: isocitrate/isopropylmalate dehydrogenase family protein [Rhodobacter sp.]|nr:isocitrate/isopropylmalate dehydrogenase family protein [Rhodobacter sp.]
MAADLRLLCLPGDGIGPEITAATRHVVSELAQRHGIALEWSEMAIGFVALDAGGTTIPQAVIEAATAADGVILGPVSHNEYPPVACGGLNPSGVLRKSLGLYANIRPAHSYPGLPHPLAQPVDLVVVRENLEGFYADRNMYQGPGEVMPVPGVALATRLITAQGSERIARAAFAIAASRPARKVTAIHKANVMRLSDGLFLEQTRAVAAEFPGIAYDEMLVDAAAAHLVRDPGRFDTIVATNMFGDILSDLASELAGGLGLGPSLNHGDSHAVAQAQHGSAPDIAGQDRANPVSLVASAAMLLHHLGAQEPAAALHAAIARTLANPATRTADIGGPSGTVAFTEALVQNLDQPT